MISLSYDYNELIRVSIGKLNPDFRSLITSTSMFEIEITQQMLDTRGRQPLEP